MARGDVDIKITAKDTASTILNRVADNAEQLEKLDPKIIIEASDKASDNLDKVIARANALDGDTATVILEAEAAKAESEIRGIQRALGSLDGEVATAAITAKDNASARLDKIQAELRELDGRKVEVEVTADTGALPGQLSKITGFLSGPGGAVAGTAALVAGLGAVGKAAGDAAIEVDTLAQLTGSSVDATGRLASVWKATGAQVTDLADVIAQVNGVLADTPELAAQLGIELEGANPQEIFLQATDAVNGMTDATDKLVLGSKLFGEEGVRQVGAVNASLEEGVTLSEKLADVESPYDEADVARARKMAAQQAELNAQMAEFAAEMTKLLPIVTELLGGLNSALVSINENPIEGKFREEIDDIGMSIRGQQYAAEAARRSNTLYAGSVDEVGYQSNLAGRALTELTDKVNAQQEAFAQANREIDRADTTYNAFVTSVDKVGDAYGDLKVAAGNVVEGMEAVRESIKENGRTLDENTEKGRANLDAAVALRDEYQTGLANALKAAGGNYDAVRNRAETYRQELEDQLTQAGLTKAQIKEYQRVLGLTPEDIETTIKLSKYEDAMTKLGLLQGVIQTLDEKAQVEIGIDIAAGDFESALRKAQAYMAINPLLWKVKFDFPKGRPATGSGVSGGPTMAPVTTNVTVNMPRGVRGDDVVTAMNRHAARNGRRR